MIMIPQVNRIEANLIPLRLFSRRVTMMPPDYQSAPIIGAEVHLMMFSIMPRRSIVPLAGDVLHARASAFTLYATGTLFGLFCYSLALDRLVKAIEEQSPPIDVVVH
jgi:hypothetical protein